MHFSLLQSMIEYNEHGELVEKEIEIEIVTR